MIFHALVILQAATAQLPPPEAHATPFDAVELPEIVLAEQRGGIRLPGGINVALTIDTVTAVDGRIVLQTITRIADASPVVTAYAPEDGASIPLAARGGAENLGGTPPQISYDRQHGLTVTAGLPPVPLTVSRTAGATNEATPAEGLRTLDLSRPVTTTAGLVQARGAGGRSGVELIGADIQIFHLTGNAIGSAIANSGSDRSIDTATTLSIDLRNAGPDVLGSTMLRVEDVALRALATRF